MEKYFEGLRCKKEYKVSLAKPVLEGESGKWFYALEKKAEDENRQFVGPIFSSV